MNKTAVQLRNLPVYIVAAWLVTFLFIAPAFALDEQTATTTNSAVPLFTLTASPELAHEDDLITATVRPENFSAPSAIFHWSKNGIVMEAASGAGKNVFRFPVESDQTGLLSIAVAVDAGPGFSPATETVSVVVLPTLPSGAQFELEATDRAPEPGDTIGVSVKTFSFDKISATYRWYVNGAFMKDASGPGQWQIVLPPIRENQEFLIRADAILPDGASESRTIAISAVRAPMYWWANTSVPYWYRAKALPTIGSEVSVLAMPGLPGKERANFQWRFNDLTLPASSGLGKSVFRFVLQYPVAERISVAVHDESRALSKEVSLNIAPFDPVINIYELRPLTGIAIAKKISAFAAPGGTSYRFQAVPFFTLSGGATDFHWRVEGIETAKAAANPEVLRLNTRGAARGAAEVSIPAKGKTLFGSFEYDFQ